ncbi:hypothetical protein IGJ04_003081 [Enterococcus sp. AZ050]
MKKKLVKGLVICGMIGIGFTALGTNVEAATYPRITEMVSIVISKNVG